MLFDKQQDIHTILYYLIVQTLDQKKEEIQKAIRLKSRLESKAADNMDLSSDNRHAFDLKRAQSNLARLQAPNMYQPLKEVFQKVMDQNRELAEMVENGVIQDDGAE